MSRLHVDIARRPCMDEAEFDDWTRHNRMANAESVMSPCADCLLPFALDMRAAGRCDGTPGWRRRLVLSEVSTPERPVYVVRDNPRRDRAKHLHDLGFSNVEIASAIGVSKSAVSRYLIGRSRRRSLEQVRARMRQRQQAARKLRAKGLTVVAIADKLGVSDTMARRYLEGAA